MTEVTEMTHEVKIVKFGVRGGKKLIEHKKFATQSEAFAFMDQVTLDPRMYGVDYCDTGMMRW